MDLAMLAATGRHMTHPAATVVKHYHDLVRAKKLAEAGRAFWNPKGCLGPETETSLNLLRQFGFRCSEPELAEEYEAEERSPSNSFRSDPRWIRVVGLRCTIASNPEAMEKLSVAVKKAAESYEHSRETLQELLSLRDVVLSLRREYEFRPHTLRVDYANPEKKFGFATEIRSGKKYFFRFLRVNKYMNVAAGDFIAARTLEKAPVRGGKYPLCVDWVKIPSHCEP